MGVRELTPDALFSPFHGHDGTIVGFLRKMVEHGLDAATALEMHEAWLDALAAEMTAAQTMDAAVTRATGNVRRRPGQADAEFLLGPCPRCGREVWGIKKCPHISPPWRTFFACDSDDCAYHGRSRLDIDELRRNWPDGVEAD